MNIILHIHLRYIIQVHTYTVPYSQKVWWKENLANLVSEQYIAKLKSTKLFVQYKLLNSSNFILVNTLYGKFTKVSSHQFFYGYNYGMLPVNNQTNTVYALTDKLT